MIPLGNTDLRRVIGHHRTQWRTDPGSTASVYPDPIVVLFRGTVTRYQWRGITIAMTGVITVITRGDPAILTQMDFNRGDLWLVGASIGIACYQTLIGRVTKDLHPVVLLQVP